MPERTGRPECEQAKGKFEHAHARSAPKRIQACNNSAPCAVRAWHASRALGAGAYPHHAGQDLRTHDAKKTRRRPPRQHEVGTVAPGGPSMPSRRLEPTSGPSGSSTKAPPRRLPGHVPVHPVGRPDRPTRLPQTNSQTVAWLTYLSATYAANVPNAPRQKGKQERQANQHNRAKGPT